MLKLLQFAIQENCIVSFKPNRVNKMVRIAISNNEKKVAIETRVDPEGMSTGVADSAFETLIEGYNRAAYPEKYANEEQEGPEEPLSSAKP